MARGRKAASDSTHQQVRDAQAADLSATSAPDIPGASALNKHGRAFYDDLWRSAPERWTAGDLAMMVEAAFVQQRMIDNRVVMMMVPPVVTAQNGIQTRNPIHTLQFDLARQLQQLLRDLGVRSKDQPAKGQERTRPAAPTPTANTTSPAQVPDFDSWLDQVH
ncbi:hypothetical protein [Primorskyibacter sp. S87]|uniref:hypothetical protein n=1 Tax=Primorskyibacter sp. S87 TaxID=3415126 RepID=UPI003C7D1723